MRYKENWPSVQARYREYWARENHDRPLLAITAPKDGPQAGKPAAISHATLKERWFDTDDLLEQVNSRFQNTYLGAEALPVYSPNLGPDVFAAFYGVELAYGEDTSWSWKNCWRSWIFWMPAFSTWTGPTRSGTWTPCCRSTI